MTDIVQTKRHRTRDQLLVAAQELLLAEGAAVLGVRRVATQAGLVHSSFYNYYADTGALLDGLASLLVAGHLKAVGQVRDGIEAPAELFAVTTRQTLRIFQASPRYTRLMFDSGIPVDRLSRGLGAHMRQDLRAGVRDDSFRVHDLDVAVTIASGAILALALAHLRRSKRAADIDGLTLELLRMLGVPAERAEALATAKVTFSEAPAIPMTWKALGLVAPD
ncbi:TetR/AcrR family transcriptional regulator [Zavarzinia aquatilis]|nr:TetR/AcrR family transcriptional regulator [Zavarzinia aquatilis]